MKIPGPVSFTRSTPPYSKRADFGDFKYRSTRNCVYTQASFLALKDPVVVVLFVELQE